MKTLDVRDVENDFDDMLSKIRLLSISYTAQNDYDELIATLDKK